MHHLLRYFLVGLGILMSFPMFAQTRLEYYWDTDPGIGKATQLATSNEECFAVTQNIPTASLTQGVHQLVLRAINAQVGQPTYTTRFVLITSDKTESVTEIEYFWDEDPGFGKGMVVAFPEGQAGSPFAIDLNTSDLSDGVHKLGIRAKAGRHWSQTETRAFLINNEGMITRMEYFWDDEDPGQGNAIPLDIKPAHEIQITDLALPLTGLSFEEHTLNIRAMSESNVWSDTQRIKFKNVNSAGEYVISVTCNDGGTVSASAQRVNDGDPVTFTFKPNTGYELAKVTMNGTDVTALVADDKYTISGVIDDINLQATFALKHYTITCKSNEGGTVIASESEVDYGGNVTVSVVPDSDCKLISLSVNGEDRLDQVTDNKLLLQNIQSDMVIEAVFERPDAIVAVQTESTSFKKVNGGVEFNNAPIGKKLTIYNISGIPIKVMTIDEENFVVKLPWHNTYIIQITDRTFKISL